jgi:ribose transport system ATP-binding protein
LALRATSPRQLVGELSGGNQQKVVFARGLAGETQVLMLDEPTRGIDVGAKQELYQLIRQLTAQGVGILLVSSELPELLGLADRLLVLHEGRQTALLNAGEVDEETVLRYCYGLEREGVTPPAPRGAPAPQLGEGTVIS